MILSFLTCQIQYIFSIRRHVTTFFDALTGEGPELAFFGVRAPCLTFMHDVDKVSGSAQTGESLKGPLPHFATVKNTYGIANQEG